MRNCRIVAVALLLAWLPEVLAAGNLIGVGSFSRQVPGTDRQIPVTSATFADKVFYKVLIRANEANDGEHLLQVTVYDGNGREVYNSESKLIIKAGQGGASVSYGFNATRDAPGLWWYVVALDDRVVVSNSLNVSQ